MPAKLDPFVDVLLRERGDQLYLLPDEPVTLVKDGKPRKVSKQPLTDQHIYALLVEVAPSESADHIDQGAETEFDYVADRGMVRVRIVPEMGRLTAVVAPMDRAVAGAAAAAAPRAGEPPLFRTHGEMTRQTAAPLTIEQVELMLLAIMPDRNRAEWKETGDSDFAYEIAGLARFRVNAARDRKGPLAVFRVIPAQVVTVDQLHISKEVQQLCYLTKGLVLVTGPTGSGKSTTLCALVDLVNRTRTDHIITIED